MRNIKQHWETIYESKADNEVSWFQKNPTTSIRLIETYCKDKNSRIADIGGGNSLLAAALDKKQFKNITVLDISAKGLERSRRRIPNAPIKWVESDILNCPLVDIEIWHDRAVFHFLTDVKYIKRYVDITSNEIVKGGYLILGTFSETGPEKCSGLTITQYSKTKFQSLFGEHFKLIECFNETHHTPFNTQQNFIWVVLQRS